MRILKLRFQNLNSLIGKWQIDFTHPAYADEGIFAITGATGAGKSTILDAICLALYGATPRLGEITSSKNDLMSRQTGECFSEVIFQTNSKIYQVFWGQKKAHKKAEGKLQSPKHQLYEWQNEDSSTILEEKASITKTKIEEITGMDFKRFTQSMLLAQGSFAAFLQAEADERSNLLEQITGTEIYGVISKKVHDFKTTSERELASLKDKLSGMNLLSDEEEQHYCDRLAMLKAEIATTQNDIATTEQDKIWRNNLNDFNTLVLQYSQEKDNLLEQKQAFAPQLLRLQRALKTLEIRSDVDKLAYLSEQLTAQQNEIEQLNQQLPIANHDIDHAQQNLANQQLILEQIETEWQHEQPRFNRVRELDTTLNQYRQQWQDNSDYLQHLQQAIHQKSEQLTSQNASLHHLTAEHQQKIALQQQIPSAEHLPQTLATLRQLQETVQEYTRQQQSLSQDHTKLSDLQAQSEQQATQLANQLQQSNEQLTEQTQARQNLENQLNQTLNGQTISDLRQQAEQFWQAQNLLESMKNATAEWQHNQQLSEKNRAEFGKIAKQLTALDTDWQRTTVEQQHAEKEVDLLSRNLLLLAKIEDLTKERDHLIDGQPCPLCGAIKHPYATHTPAPPDQTEQELTHAKQQLKTLEKQLEKMLMDKHSWQYQQQNLNEQQSQLTERNGILINHLQLSVSQLQPFNLPNFGKLSQVFDNLKTSTDANNVKNLLEAITHFSQLIEQFLQNLKRDAATLQNRLATIDNLDKQLKSNQQQLDNARQAVSDQRHQQIVLTSERKNRQTRLADIYQQQRGLSDKQNHLQRRIDELTSTFNVPNHLSVTERIVFLQQLLEQHQTLYQAIQALSEQINFAKQTIATLTANEQNLRQDEEQWQQRQQDLGQKLQHTQTERQQLFGDKPVEAEAQRLNQHRQQALHALRQSEQIFNEVVNRQQVLQQKIETLTTNIAQSQSHQTHVSKILDERFAKLGFANLADYQTAVMPDTERETLQQRANQLSEGEQRNDSLLAQAQARQQALLATPRTELTAEQILTNLTQLQNQLSALLQQSGGVENKLAENNQRKTDQTHLLEQIATQSQHTKEWKDLHELIGSSDGKKFRNFAQGLTFNIMIAHANDQLSKMSERYLLLADKEQPLMLNVMDTYQGGEIRTSKNLSGGESFIISLSLALGLSNMASHRMQVDSLFLDEGFGTLDEEALDVALDTLTTLQQSGKLIGVISHVQALKDRISRQIQVVPMTGGVSKIEGIGVKKLG